VPCRRHRYFGGPRCSLSRPGRIGGNLIGVAVEPKDGWLEMAGTGEAPRRREEVGPQWLPDSSEQRPVAWGRGTAREGEAGSSGGAWPSDSVVVAFGEE
jgi:hypothetical protein